MTTAPSPSGLPAAAATTLHISLVAHTNAGKTTLARTLLGRDVGEVRDEAHVTTTAEPHLLITSPQGDRLLLWDTPGFGDSVRLARRLAQAGNPLGWLLTQVWDRFRDRAFWASQQAIRHVLGQADVAIYLVNAAEAPQDAAYLAPELQVLALLGKPVVVVLNQLGPPGTAADEAAQLSAWQAHLAPLAGVHSVLALDAFARCWVQEGALLRAVLQALPSAQQPAMARLSAAWGARAHSTWQAAMALLAQRVGRAVVDREALAGSSWAAPLRAGLQRLVAALGAGADADSGPQATAMAALADRLDAEVRRSTEALIGLHGLDGRASGEVLGKLARHFAKREPVSEGRAALWGGLVTGALAGLKADIASGGLTLGGGLLAGGVLGALGAAGAARGINRVRGLDRSLLAWDDRVIAALLQSALLGYLAVAHHGRGRGAWQQLDPPAAWVDAVGAALAAQQPALQALWQQRPGWMAEALAAPPPDPAPGSTPGAAPSQAQPPAALLHLLQTLLRQASADVLLRLYPDAAAAAGLAAPAAAPPPPPPPPP